MDKGLATNHLEPTVKTKGEIENDDVQAQKIRRQVDNILFKKGVDEKNFQLIGGGLSISQLLDLVKFFEIQPNELICATLFNKCHSLEDINKLNIFGFYPEKLSSNNIILFIRLLVISNLNENTKEQLLDNLFFQFSQLGTKNSNIRASLINLLGRKSTSRKTKELLVNLSIKHLNMEGIYC